MDDLKTFCCQNPQCPDYGRRGLDNLRVCFHNGPNKERRVLACRTCQKRFSERKGSALYRCKLPDQKALAVLQHLQESCGVRQTGRLVGVNKDTVVRLALVAGQHAQDVPGKRTETHTQLLVEDFKRRTGGRLMNLMTSDGYPAYPKAIFEAYAEVREQ